MTYEQMMSGDGLPEQCVRMTATARDRRPISRAMQDQLRDSAREKFAARYGKAADSVVAAEKGDTFVCVAYRVCP